MFNFNLLKNNFCNYVCELGHRVSEPYLSNKDTIVPFYSKVYVDKYISVSYSDFAEMYMYHREILHQRKNWDSYLEFAFQLARHFNSPVRTWLFLSTC